MILGHGECVLSVSSSRRAYADKGKQSIFGDLHLNAEIVKVVVLFVLGGSEINQVFFFLLENQSFSVVSEPSHDW